MKKLVLPFLAVAALLTLAVIPPASVAAKPPASPVQALTMLLELRHPAGLDRFVRSVSDPESPSYREYATVEELVERFGARKQDRAAAMRWLARREVRGQVGPTGTYLIARVPAPFAWRELPLLASASSASISPNVARRVPAFLRGHVTAIETLGTTPGAFGSNAQTAAGTVHGQVGLKGTSIVPNTGTPAGCAEGRAAGEEAPLSGFTPNEYLDAYGHSALQGQGFEGQGKDVALIEIDGVRKSDVATFAKCFGVPTPNIQVRPVGIRKPLPPGPETTLDLEIMSVAAPKLEHAYVYEGDSSELGILLSVAASLGTKGHHPDAISISLGGCEAGLFGQLAFRDALDNVFAVADGAGISVVVAAGDQGSSACRVDLEDGTHTALPLLAASDPASSPYVTAVGGTNFVLGKKNQIRSEIVWNDSPLEFGGGGGALSILTSPRPWWQRGLRANYGNGRLVPDVSGLADILPGYAIYCTAPECASPDAPEGGWTAFGGTSAATPLYAGGVLLADGYEGSRGEPPLGFLNPLIYAVGRRAGTGGSGSGPGRVLRDVTQGDNDLGVLTPVDAGGGKPLGCCSATPGYDVASGWGSVNLPALAHVGLRAARRR